MQRRTLLLFSFIFCLLLVGILFGIGKATKTMGFVPLQIVFAPVQKGVMGFFYTFSSKDEEELKKENLLLQGQITKLQLIQQDNKALHDQFQTTTPSSQEILPVSIIGMPGFLPGVTIPDMLVVAIGSHDGVRRGQGVVYQNILLGTIETINQHFSTVRLITSSSVSFTAKTAQTGALGILKGDGNGQMELDNVVLSDTLKTGDMVVTAADVDEKGNGLPPGLIIGKITSVDKKPTNLFQKAYISTLVDVTKLTTVFVISN